MNIDSLLSRMHLSGLSPWAELLPLQIQQGLSHDRFGDLKRWQAVLDQLPLITADAVALTQSSITITAKPEISLQQQSDLTNLLFQLKPWRKGPYTIHGVHIDTEWRSDLKWDRLENHIQPLRHKTILDIGCGSGYHGWRMIGAGADLVIGIDPSPLFVMQFQAVKHFAGEYPFYALPLGIESVPDKMRAFDTVFSMGVLYHRRSPMEHLIQCREALKSGGELVLESLVIEGDAQTVLLPQDRYAKMRNVWFLPSTPALAVWLERCGFVDIQLIDESITTNNEQRSTSWMQYESLTDFLDTNNPALTVEGYPAPRRAIFSARAP